MIEENNSLRIAIPSKGRLKEKSVAILQGAGLKVQTSGRQLFARCPNTDILVIFSHAQDIPGLVYEGVVDLGITGSDLVIEKRTEVEELMRLSFGKCRLSFASHIDSNCINGKDFSGKIIGTKFMHLAEDYFSKNNVKDVNIIEINGAVEVIVLLGLVDGILDVVETGNTLREHDLVERETILQAEAVLIGNGKYRDGSMKDKLIRRIEGVLQSKKYSMLEFNCPVDKLNSATDIAPGFSAPTIQETADSNWRAVKAMVEKKQVQTIMDELENIGCQAIVETMVNHCRL